VDVHLRINFREAKMGTELLPYSREKLMLATSPVEVVRSD
jgi:hypothetical protein